MINIKNKISISVALCVAILCYQLHGSDYFRTFSWPEWLNFGNVKQQTYNLFASPLFWITMGSGMIVYAAWNLRKSPLVSPPQVGATVGRRTPENLRNISPGQNESSQEVKAERARHPRTVESVDSSQTVVSMVSEIIQKMSDEDRAVMCRLSNEFLRNNLWFTQELHLPSPFTCNAQSIIAFFTNLKTHFRVLYLLTRVLNSYRDERWQIRAQGGAHDFHLAEPLKMLIYTYSLQYLFALFSKQDMAVWQDYFKQNNIMDYFIAQLPLSEARQAILSFKDIDEKLSSEGKALRQVILKFFNELAPTRAYRTGHPDKDIIDKRIVILDELPFVIRAYETDKLDVAKFRTLQQVLLYDANLDMERMGSVVKEAENFINDLDEIIDSVAVQIAEKRGIAINPADVQNIRTNLKFMLPKIRLKALSKIPKPYVSGSVEIKKVVGSIVDELSMSESQSSDVID